MIFDEWFELQFGKAPTHESWSELDEELIASRRNTHRLEGLMRELDDYLTRRDAAVKAWYEATKACYEAWDVGKKQ